MKKLWPITGLVVLAALIGITLISIAGGPSGPEYHGRKLTSWLEDLHNPSALTRTNAALAIRQMGTNAVPFLVQMLHAKDAPFKRICMGLLERQRLILFHFRYDFQKRENGLQGLAVLGPDGKAAIIEENKGDDFTAGAIYSALVDIDP